MKRFLSLLLAMTMLVALLPANAVFAASGTETPAKLEYVFSYKALGATADVQIVDGDTDDSYTKTGTDPWDYQSRRSCAKGMFVQNGMWYRAVPANSTYETDTTNNGIAFKINVAKAGEYSLNLGYSEHQLGGNVRIYVLDQATCDANKWDLSARNGAKYALQTTPNFTIDTYNADIKDTNFKTVEKKTLGTVQLSEGANYIIFGVDNKGKLTTENPSTGFYYGLVQSLTFTEVIEGEEDENDDGIYEYKTNWYALSGDKLPKTTDKTLYTSGPYVRKSGNGILQSPGIMNSTAKSVLDASGAACEEWNIMDFSVTDPWDFVVRNGADGPKIAKDNNALYFNFKVANYGSATSNHFAAIRVYVKKGGVYNLGIDSANCKNGPVPAVYFIKDDGTVTDVAGVHALVKDKEPVGYHSFADTESTGYKILGKVQAESNSSYLVIFFPDKTSLEKNSVTTNDEGVYQQFYLNGIRLSPVPKGLATISLNFKGETEESSTLSEFMEKELEYKLFDEDGTELEEVSEDKLSVSFKSSDESVATVSDKGVVTAVGEGDARITATVSYDGVGPVEDFVDLKVIPSLAGEYKYVFNSGALGESSDLKAAALLEYTLEDIDPKVSMPWKYEGHRGGNDIRTTPATGTSYMRINARNASNDYTKFGEYAPSLAITISVPESGVYLPKFNHKLLTRGFIYNVYLSKRLDTDAKISGIPLKNRIAAMDDSELIGTVDSYGPVDYADAETKEFKLVSLDKGEYLLVFAIVGRNPLWTPSYAEHKTSPWMDEMAFTTFTLKGAQLFDKIGIFAEKETLPAGEEMALSVKGYLAGGKETDISGVSVEYESLTPEIVSVDNASGVVKGLRDGKGKVRSEVTFNGYKATDEIEINVVDENPIVSAEISTSPAIKYLGETALELTGKTGGGFDLNQEKAEIVWHISEVTPADGVELREGGILYGATFGATAKVYATVALNGASVDTEAITVSVGANSGKTGRTYYTDERVSAARENVQTYSWAKSIKDAAIKEADKYVGQEDKLWNLIPGEGIPRGYGVGYRDDPEYRLCRYCGENLLELYAGNYIINSLTRPWKIQCPACKRQFPSNDFASLYELGKNDKGIYDVELARARNAELVENGEQGYLVNVLYPEITKSNLDPRAEVLEKRGIDPTVDGSTWGVDDGFGYKTGRQAYNEDTEKFVCDEVHTYVANYNYYTWYGGDIQKAVNSLRDAYLYTGDVRYGRTGAILVDRIADLYPGFDLDPLAKMGFANGDGGSKVGKIIGRIHETYLQEDFVKAYDAFFPLYDDEQVISFLSGKAKTWTGIENKKLSGDAIRMNIEDNLLRESFEAIKNSKSNGNFGMCQSTCALVASVLDTSPYTEEMFAWLENYMQTDYKTYNTGGGVIQRLVNDVSRDGQGNESAPGYNRLWVDELTNVAEILSIYGYDGIINLYENPKYIGMIKSYAPLTLIRRGVPPIADSGLSASFSALPDTDEVMINGFKYTGDIEMAQHFYMLKKGDLKEVHYDVFTKDPESIQKEIENIIDTYGEYNYDKSSMLTGYGFGALRSGSLYESVGADVLVDTQRDAAMYFGGAVTHLHKDALQLFVDAYGIGVTTDLGYPTATGQSPVRYQWESTSISHNTVVVNEKEQLVSSEPAKPLHFDAKDTRVKVMQVDASDYYAMVDEYDRTVVMVDYDSEISYTLDFFKILGGYDHLYSFHANSDVDPIYSDNLTFVPQEGGTYAGPDQALGQDPTGTYSSGTYINMKYPTGYTWMDDVKRCDNPGVSDFWVEYDITDFRKHSRNDGMDIKLRLTMVNDFEVSEVSLTNGYPPDKPNNVKFVDHLEYMLVRRSAENENENLNTLFTTVIEPYNKTRYIKSIEAVPVTVVDGEPGETDIAKAVKVELENGRCDYVVYAENGDVTYNVADKFSFRGFVGVWSENEEGKNIYKYVNDGEMIGNDESKLEGLDAKVGGKILGFQKELSFDNWMDVEFDREIGEEEMLGLRDRLIVVEREGAGNSAYVIRSVSSKDSTHARIDLGNVTLIDKYTDITDLSQGFEYDVAVGRSFEIPMSYEDNMAPVFEEIADISASAGSTVSIKVHATSEIGDVEYAARQLPRGAGFDEETATVTWKPGSAQIGENLIAIDAIDGEGRVSTLYFTIKVSGSTSGNTQTQGGGGGGGGETTTPTTPDKPDEPSKPETPSAGEAGSSPEGGAKDTRFIDLGSHAWAEEAINSLADKGIIKGTSETTFSPANNITRADFAILLVRAFEKTSDNDENFSDVSASDYFAKELAIARNTGLVSGIGDNKFAPRENIKRCDMMLIVYRALSETDALVGRATPGTPEYEDFNDVPEYAKDAVAALISAGLVDGKGDKIAPNDFTTRAEVAVLLNRVLNSTEEK